LSFQSQSEKELADIKRMLSVLLALALCLALLAVPVAAETSGKYGENLTRTPDSKGTEDYSVIKPVSEWIGVNQHCYLVYDTSMTWYEARDFCESVGGHLVTITSQEEQEDIEALLDRTYAPIRYLAEYFGYSVDWDGNTKTVLLHQRSS
jgi:hypothetical protein